MMEANATHASGMRFDVALGSGYAMQIDASREAGGEGLGARPMELLLAGLAGCTGMDVIGMMRKARQEVTGYEVHVTGERASDYPMVFTTIDVEHVVRGRGISEETLKRAIHLSEAKYCSASAMLCAVAKIETSYRILEE